MVEVYKYAIYLIRQLNIEIRGIGSNTKNAIALFIGIKHFYFQRQIKKWSGSVLQVVCVMVKCACPLSPCSQATL